MELDDIMHRAQHPSMDPAAMQQMMASVVDPFANLPMGPEPVKWDCSMAQRESMMTPKMDEEGNLIVDDEGQPVLEKIPKQTFAIVRFIQANNMSRVWLNRQGVAQLKQFLEAVDEQLMAQETGIQPIKSKIIIP